MKSKFTLLVLLIQHVIQQRTLYKHHVVASRFVIAVCCLFSVQPAFSQVCSPCSNIVTNGDFSSGSSGWTVSGPWAIDIRATAYNGSTAMNLSQTVTGLGFVPSAQVGNVVLTFTYSAGNINGSSSPTANIANMYVELDGTVYLTITNGVTNTIGFSTGLSGATVSYSPNPYTTPGNMWVNSTAVTLTIPWPSASKPNSALLNFRFVALDNGDDMGIDNVSLLGGSFTLPIKLSTLTATKKDNAVMLNWTTASEINNQGFKILRSANGRSFDTLAFVPSRAENQGNSSATLLYGFIDKAPANGNNYYRILQVDKDGRTEISSIVQIVTKGMAIVKVFPDPVGNELHVEGVAAGSSITILNLSGKTLARSASATIPVSTLAPGTYLLRVQSGNEVSTSKFVKK